MDLLREVGFYTSSLLAQEVGCLVLSCGDCSGNEPQSLASVGCRVNSSGLCTAAGCSNAVLGFRRDKKSATEKIS